MNNLLKCLLIIAMSAHMAGCGILGQSPEIEYISPQKDVSLNIGESAIVHGAMEQCGREPRFWSDVTHLLPTSETGYFSNGGSGLMKSEKCGGSTLVLAVKFTANKIGAESLTVLGDTVNIVVGDNVNFLHSSVPNPKKTSSPNSSILDRLFDWAHR